MSMSSVQPLCAAAARADLAAVEAALAAGASINERSREGDTALHIAVRKNSTAIVSRLLEAAADVSAIDKQGNVALHLAVEGGNTDIVALLLQMCDVDVNMTTSSSWTALDCAILRGHVAVVHQLLQAGANVNLKNTQSRTPLHNASELGMIDIVDALLGCKGIEVDARDDYDNTPLYWAAMRGHTSVVSRLLEAGADINAASRDKMTPLIAALNSNRVDVARLLLQTPTVDVRAQTDKRWTALHAAAFYGYFDIVRQLLDAGADVDANCVDGVLAPLHHAACEGFADVVELLLRYGANPNAVTDTREAPLHVFGDYRGYYIEGGALPLRRQSSVAIVKLLLEYGADANAVNVYRFTALNHAIFEDHYDSIVPLLASGAKFHESAVSILGLPL